MNWQSDSSGVTDINDDYGHNSTKTIDFLKVLEGSVLRWVVVWWCWYVYLLYVPLSQYGAGLRHPWNGAQSHDLAGSSSLQPTPGCSVCSWSSHRIIPPSAPAWY